MAIESRQRTVFVPTAGGSSKDGATPGENVTVTDYHVTQDGPAPSRRSGNSLALSDEGQFFAGSLIIIGLASFIFAKIYYDVNLFDHWIFWFSTLGVTSLLIAVFERGQNFLGGFIFSGLMVYSVLVICRILGFSEFGSRFVYIAAPVVPIVFGICCIFFGRLTRISMYVCAGSFVLIAVSGALWYFFMQ